MARRQVEEEKPRRTTRKTAPEKEVKAPPVRRRSSKTEVAVADAYESPRERAKKALATNLDLADALDAIEKHYGMSGSSVSKDEPRQDTGLLVIDLILGRGLVPGWYTIFGPEQSCKSTTAVTILANMLNSLVDVILYFDYEGSAEPNYLQNIMKQGGVTMPIDQVFGIKDDEGNWKVKPRVRYYTESVGEKFFDYMAKLLRVLPDKKRIGKEWFLIYENTKENQKICGSRYDKDYLRKTGLLRIPAPDGKLQAVVLLDSYPGMLPEKLDTDDPNSAIGAQARMFSDQIKRIKGKFKAKRVALLGINQLRDKPMVMFGSPHYEPGGNALKFFSDVRLQATPRALSGVPEAKGKGYNEEEDSVTHKGSDTYRYIHLRAAKNKLSQPGGEGWLRLWIEDATGEARGFDPVWDTYQYLKATGQVQGSRSRGLKLNVNGHECKKALDWYDFKLWVLGTKEDKVKVCKYLGFPKPFCIRKYCRKQLNSGDGWQRFLDAKQVQNEEDKVKKSAKSEGSDDDE